METKIKGTIVRITPAIIRDLEPTFSCSKGRRFSYQPIAPLQLGFKDVSLNDLILAIKNTPIKTEHNLIEIKAFIHAFKSLKNKGYENNSPLNKQNFLARLITRIKHFFSNIKRNKIFKELVKKTLQAKQLMQINIKNHNRPQFIVPDAEPKESIGPIVPFNFCQLPEDMQCVLLSHLDSKSFLSFYRTSNKSRALIEKRLAKELRKSKFIEQAFLAYQKVFSLISLIPNPKEFETLTYQFATSYPKELLQKFKKAFVEINDPKNMFVDMSTIVKASKALSSKYPKTLIKMLEQTINIQQGFDYLLDCIKIIATIDPKKAFSFSDLIKFSDVKEVIIAGMEGNLDQLFESVNALEDEHLKTWGFERILCNKKMSREYTHLIQKVLDACQAFSPRNLLYIKQMASIAYTQLGHFEKSMELVKETGFYHWLHRLDSFRGKMVIRNCIDGQKDLLEADKFLQEILLFIQKKQNEQLKDKHEWVYDDILIQIAHAYVKTDPEKTKLILEKLDLDQLMPYAFEDLAKVYISIDIEKAKELSKRVDPGTRKNELLMEIAKFYVGKDPAQVKAIFDEMDLTIEDAQLTKLSKACLSIDIEKANEIAHRLGIVYLQVNALLEISDFLKKDNLQASNVIAENALNLSLVHCTIQQQTYTKLKIACQKAEINLNSAKQFLEDALNIDPKVLLIEAAIGNSPLLNSEDFELLVSTYALLYPDKIEALVKSKDFEWEAYFDHTLRARVLFNIAQAI